MNNKSSLLTDRSVIAISGDDAREFLQGLITNDIHKVTKDNAIFAALLSPQGKFLYDFFIIEYEGRLLLDVDKAAQADLVKRLTMYKLRSKVEIMLLPDMRVGWSSELVVGGTLPPVSFHETSPAGSSHSAPPRTHALLSYTDPRLPELGIRSIGANLVLEDIGEYDLYRVNLGVPEGGKDLEANAAFPMQWGYDKLNAIDFNKGCYVGQEVTARSKHIGTMRKMVYQVTADKALPARGTPVMAGEQEIGKMGSSVGNAGLALLNIEAVQSGAKFYSEGREITAALPAWAGETDQPA